MSGEVWISDVAELVIDGDCVRAVLLSGNEQMVLRGSRHTLVKMLGMGSMALKGRCEADVVRIRKKPPRHH